MPDIDSKYYAATQVMDEARHVETYSRYLDKIETTYPINPNSNRCSTMCSATRGGT